MEIVLPLLGLIASVAVPLFIHRATHPARRVSYSVDALPLGVPPGSAPASRVTVRLWSSGRTDVPSSVFDSGRPITFQFATPILDDLSPAPEHEIDGWGFAREGENRLIFPPALIGHGTEYSRTVVVTDPVRYLMRHPLADVEMVRAAGGPEPAGRRRLRVSAMVVGAGLIALGFLVQVIATAVTVGSGTTDYLGLGFLTLLSIAVIVAGVVTLLVSGIARLTRRAAARRARTVPEPAAG